MKDSRILTARAKWLMRRDRRKFNKAMVDAASLTGHAHRKMNRLAWEGDRSPSKLGRAGERAQQVNAAIIPAAMVATTLFQALTAGMDAWERYERFKGRNNPKDVQVLLHDQEES